MKSSVAVNSQHPNNIRRISVHSTYRNTSAKLNDALDSGKDDGHVQVAVRCRPMSEKETKAGYESIVELESDKRIVVHDVSELPSDQLGTNSKERRNVSNVYDFDYVFDTSTQQKDIYDKVCKPIVSGALDGYNGTIFAYGQTGTGKTYTMNGPDHGSDKNNLEQLNRSKLSSSNSSGQNNSKATGLEKLSKLNIGAHHEEKGIIPRTFQQIFDHVAEHSDVQFLIRASYLEIYQEEIRDLLRKDTSTKLELHERSDVGIYVKDLTSFVCKSIGEIERVMRVGNQNRSVGATDMNEHSSRSHAIFMITIEQQAITTSNDESSQKNEDSRKQQRPVIRVGKLNLVDLAGCERQRKTNSFGQRQKESIKINLSLSTLGNVINSLVKIQQHKQSSQHQMYTTSSNNVSSDFTHIPYRDSKLTRLLQDSLGGSAKTLMIANIGPASYNYDETINTLNYASRARCIKNKPRRNEDPKDALLRELQREIDLLREKLALTNNHKISNKFGTALSSDQSTSGVSSNQSSRQSSGITKANLATNSSSINGEQIEKEYLELKQKLSSLESKLLNSDRKTLLTAVSSSITSKQIVDKDILMGLTQEQELELERQKSELSNQAKREQAIRDELERREEAEMLAKQSFNTIQQEVDAKRRLIRQVLLKVKSIRDDIDSQQRAYRIELDELDQLQCVLQKELKLKCLIMDNFIPNNHVDQILSRIVYDEKSNICQIQSLDQSMTQLSGGHHISGGNRLAKLAHYWRPTYNSIRPRTEFERISEAIYPYNILYKYEDLIEPQLNLFEDIFEPKRRLDAKLKPATEPSATRLQNLINDALNRREPDIVI